MKLEDLEIYKISVEISDIAWAIYADFDWNSKKVIGNQWITSVDSIGANIAEGFGRFHYLDKNKFNYNARGSLLEAIHWTNLLFKRGMVNNKNYDKLNLYFKNLHFGLNNYIKSTKNQIKNIKIT